MTLAMPSADQIKIAVLILAIGAFFAWAGLSLHSINGTVQRINDQINRHVHDPGTGQVMYMPTNVPDLFELPGVHQ